MKTHLLFVLLVPLVLCSGCSTVDKYIPAITAESLHITQTGKFSATTVEAENVRRENGKVKADKVHVRHSNAWVPLIEFEATGYERTLKPSE